MNSIVIVEKDSCARPRKAEDCPSQQLVADARAWIRYAVSVLALVAPAAALGCEPSGQTEPPKSARVIPWVEVNAPLTKVARWFPNAGRSRPDMLMRDYALEGIKVWAEVADTIIVSSRPNQIRALYPYLMEHKPKGVRIVGGLKTYNLPGATTGDHRPYDFANADGWRAIADQARDVAQITGTNVVLLDNETTLARFSRGEAVIDCARLRTSLRALRETGIVFWWNLPRVLGNTKTFPDRRKQTQKLVAAIRESLPSSVFLNGYTAWHDRTNSADLQEWMTERVGRRRMQTRLLVTPDGFIHYPGGRRRRCFTPAEAVAQIRQLGGREVNIYTGGAFWVSVARKFVQEWNKSRHP